MPVQKKYEPYKIAGQIVFWLISLALTFIQIRIVSGEQPDSNERLLFRSFLLNLCFAISVYINLKLLIPTFLKNKQYVFYTFWLTITTSSAALLTQLLFLYPFHFLFTNNKMFDHFVPEVFTSFFFAHLIYITLSSLAKFLTDWLVLQDINLRYNTVQRQKLEAELITLKAQINPHFLFNSLNNIYSMALSNSKETPKLILMLSDLMRHVLYESRKDYILLQKEIDFVTNFVELQKLRLQKSVDLQFTMTGLIQHKLIAPLMFEPFIDNAFKHGLKSPADKPFIHISFHFSDNHVSFEIKNNYAERLIAATHNEAHGIGLENIEKRLKFLYRKNEYKLLITQEDHIFSVFLKLQLKDLSTR